MWRPEVEEERPVVVALGDLLDRMVGVEELRDLVGQLVDLVEDEADLVRRQRPAHLGQLQRDQVEQRDLRRERLRRGDADLEAAARVERRVDLARDLRAHHVRDRDRVRAALLARSFMAPIVSRVSPDWEMPITSVSGPITGLR